MADAAHEQKPAAAGFFTLMLASMAGKIADQLSNARTTLPWLLQQVGAPVFLLGLLVPLRESLSMLPQAACSPWINRHHYRRHIWAAAALVQALSLVAMPLSLLMPSPLLAGLWVVGMLVLFSLARCFCSITFKDLLGKTVPKSRRGRLLGYADGAAGLVVLLIALSMLAAGERGASSLVMVALLAGAGLLWLLGAVLVLRLPEPAGQSEHKTSGLRAIRQELALLRKEADLRQLVGSRALLLCPILASPYLVALADSGASALLAGFILANGLASSLSAPLWGRFADRSSRRCMLMGGWLASLSIVPALLLSAGLVPWLEQLAYWIYLACFTLLGAAHTGIRTGRKTYVTNIAEGTLRTRYVAVSNTMIGLVLLLAGGLVALVGTFSMSALLLLLILGGIVGALLSAQLRENQG